MIGESESTSDRNISVEIQPSAEVDAATEFNIKCRVMLPSREDRGDLAVSIRDHDNAQVARAQLTQADGELYESDEITITAPSVEGAQTWLAVVLHNGDEAGTSPDSLCSTEFTFIVRAHAARVNVWDLPTAITAGVRFGFRAGVKCSAGCRLSGAELSIFDGDGVQVGSGSLRDEVWQGTSALYFAEIEARAPATVGDHRWEVRFPASQSGVPHASGMHAFTVRSVSEPDCRVRIEVLDSQTRQPIKGARIVMHPYRAVTAEDGVTKIRLVGGTYKLLVSATRYIAVSRTIEVTEDATVTTELTLEPVFDSASFYV
jgi:hypothetical protein